MKTRNLFSKVLAGLLAAVMLLSLLPVLASAAGTEGEPEVTTSGMEVNKTAVLQEDGTYTITLEAFSTGTTTTTTVTTGVPLDIVLVIDQSGSMEEELGDLKIAVEEFVGVISENATKFNVDHRIAMVGYASSEDSGTPWLNTGVFVDGKLINYRDQGDDTQPDETYTYEYKLFEGSDLQWYGSYYIILDGEYQALERKNVGEWYSPVYEWGYYVGETWVKVDANTTDIYERVTITHVSTLPSNITEQNYKDALVSVNTDGSVTGSITTAIGNLKASGATSISYGMLMANRVFENNPIDAGSDRRRIIVVFTDGEPCTSGSNYQSAEAGRAVNYSFEAKNTHHALVYAMGYYSNASNNITNFMNYLSSNYPSAKYENNSWNAGSKTADKYYLTTTNSSELSNIFSSISQDIVSSSSSTTLTETSVMKDIIGSHFDLPDTYDENGITAQLFEGTTVDGVTYQFSPEPYTGITLTTIVDKATNKVEVSGLNYSENYIAPSHPGYKIVVTIPGVVMKDDAPINEVIPTNLSTSGIYADANAETASVLFPQPKTVLVGKTYVLDYAKPVTVPTTDWFQQAIDQIGSTGSAYGKYDVAVGGTSVGYAPMTTNWNGYDSVMLFGATTEGFAQTYGLDQSYAWAKVSMIPANNVYYEDTFVSDESAGIVGITYTGEWTSVGTGENAEDANGAVQGWVEDLANDAGDSDGTIHTANTGAKATFSFSGTGFDLYSRTNMTTGKVYAKISWTDANGQAHNKGMMVNTESDSGEYHGIPTLWFNGEYNTYTVTVTVIANSNEGGSFDYCIDGIRIYNPLNPTDPEVKVDDVVNDGYKDDKVDAMFESVRDMLLDANNLSSDASVTGAVFIDRVEQETGVLTSVVGTYESVGPKNEVYLGAGQAIAFNVGNSGAKFQIGLKAPNGETVANFSGADSQATATISHSTDLYYWVLPDANGNVVIKNTGDNVLSVTKLKYISPDTDAEPTVMAVSADAMLMAVDAFDAMPVMAYSMDIEEPAPEVPVEPETPEEPETPTEPEVPEEPETPTEPESPEEPTGPNVEIENPTVPEEPDEPKVEDQIAELLKKLFSAFRGWLRP